MEFKTSAFQKIINKPWGQEILLTPDKSTYTGKILRVQAGKRLSLQYHETKEETLTLYSGQALLHVENSNRMMEQLPMELLHGYTIVPGQKHRIESITDCEIFEASSPEKGITVRVEDDYKRPDETEALRGQDNRGWNG